MRRVDFALAVGVSVAPPLRVFVCALVESVVRRLEGCVSVRRRASPFGDGRFRDGNKDKIPKVPMRQGSGFIQGGFQNNNQKERQSIKSLRASVVQRASTG